MELPDTESNPSVPATTATFSTARIPGAQRLDYWQDHNTRALIGLQIRTLDVGLLQAEEFNVYLPELRFARVRASSQIVERCERTIAQHPTGDVAIFFTLGGEAFFHHGSGTLMLRAGQAVIYNADAPFVRGFTGGVNELVLTIPQEQFLQLSRGASLKQPRVFEFATPGVAGVGDPDGSRLAALVDSVTTKPGQDLAAVQEDALELIERLVHQAMGSDRDTVYFRAMQELERLYSDPSLTRAQIAARVGVSERQLSRVFAGRQESFAQVLTARRISAAQHLLEQDRSATVAQIGRRCGFSSASAFSRAFRAHTGLTPTDVQRAVPLRDVP